MKYYIASSFLNKEIVNEIINQLDDKGFTNTYNWTLNDKASNETELKNIGQAEFEAVKKSEVLIVILPGEKGTHIEMGIALGCGIQVVIAYFDDNILDINNSATFYYLDNVSHIKVTEENVAESLYNFILELDKR